MYSYLYGPVPSWRLGRSLGVDLISSQGKTCSFDCVYCQLGRTVHATSDRAEYVSLEELAQEMESARGVTADYATFSGMGEPTLASNLADAIDLAKRMLGLPVAVLCNSSLMFREDVRRNLRAADVVVAKLDAPDEGLFQAVNRPVPGITFSGTVEGIKRLRQEYDGKLALQMMFIDVNRGCAEEMASLARQIAPDEVQINTPLRPCPVRPLSPDEMADIRTRFAGLEGVVTVYEAERPHIVPLDMDQTLKRRPKL